MIELGYTLRCIPSFLLFALFLYLVDVWLEVHYILQKYFLSARLAMNTLDLYISWTVTIFTNILIFSPLILRQDSPAGIQLHSPDNTEGTFIHKMSGKALQCFLDNRILTTDIIPHQT